MPRGALASALVAGTLCAIWALAPSIIPPPHLQLPAGSVAADVVWRLPVGCDFSGFFVELLGYVVPLTAHPQLRFAVDLGQCSAETLRQLAPREARALQEAQGRFDSSAAAHVLVDHAEPCAWKQYTAAGGAVRPWVHIGRTMTESADLSPKWLACIRGNRVHEIWVPTPFHVELFARAGVHNAVAVPEAVDTDFFAPVAAAARQALPLARHVIRNPGEFVLVSVFKWEHRKGWDVLLDAYWAAFSRDDPVTLVLCSYVPGWEPGPASVLERVREHARVPSTIRQELWKKSKNGAAGAPLPTRLEQLAKVHVLHPEHLREGWAGGLEGMGGGFAHTHAGQSWLSREEIRDVYAAADVFVLATRGEGWGLPVVEAMAMQLPVIVTNFSGPTAYLTPANSYPLEFHLPGRALGAGGRGSQWASPQRGMAEPSRDHLVEVLSHVFQHRNEARSKGEQARRDVAARLSPDVVAADMLHRIRQHIALPEAAETGPQGGPRGQSEL